MSRLAELVSLRNRVDDEIRAMVPKPLRRTAEQWLVMLPPDPNAAQHRAALEAEVGEYEYPNAPRNKAILFAATVETRENETSPRGASTPAGSDRPTRITEQRG